MIDLTFRCYSRKRWVTVATARGVYDADGNVQPGFEVDEIGNAELSPAVTDEKGNVTTPAVVDTWHWVNVRLHDTMEILDEGAVYPGDADDGFKFVKSKLAAWVRAQSTPVTLTYRGKPIRTYQFGSTTNRIQLIDPRDYGAIRLREWAGGMNF